MQKFSSFSLLFSFSFRVPGLFVCGDFVPFLCAGKGHAVFFQREEESKKRVAAERYSPLLFATSSSVFPGGKERQKAGGVQGSLRLQLVCGKNIRVLFSKRKEDQKADNVLRNRPLPFRHFFIFFFFSRGFAPFGVQGDFVPSNLRKNVPVLFFREKEKAKG